MKLFCLIFCTFFFLSTVYSQSDNKFNILFYNVENLFDTKNNPETNDDEFTPQGDRHWTNKRLEKKLLLLSKVITGANGYTPPEIIALSEVENYFVLSKLLNGTPLKNLPYNIIHKDSPDKRGIDVAILYNTKKFCPITYQYIPLQKKNNQLINTREILYISGIVNKTDTIHLFVNHWPSRYSGILSSQPLRNLAAQHLRYQINELNKTNKNPKIVIVGDFNDQPADESIQLYLKTTPLPIKKEKIVPSFIYNLSDSWQNKEKGTTKYRSQWFIFDQILISGSLLNNKGKVYTHPSYAKIITLPFLTEPDKKYGGSKPRRTYIGYRYHGGISDHLPVLIQLKY